jgi:hypothetical protein
MRRAARIDANQNEITEAFRKMGATVAITSSLGKGFPDLTIGYKGLNILIEVKDGTKPPSHQKLTPDETEFHSTWRGNVVTINSIDGAIKLLESIR